MKLHLLILLCLPFSLFPINQKTSSIYLSNALRAMKQKNKSETIENLLKAYEYNPSNEMVLIQLGSFYLHTRDYKNACKYYQLYLDRKPNNPDMLYNLSLAYNRQGKWDQSLPLLQKSYALAPDEQSHGELVKIYLRNYMWKKASTMLSNNHWWYNNNIYGKTILLEFNKPGNGVGDMIQFLRYAKYLKQAGATVIVQTYNFVKPLCECCPYIDRVIGSKDPKPSYDYAYPICIGSLMICLKHRVNLPCRDIPYIIPRKELSDYWKERLQGTDLKVGISWKSRVNKSQFLGETLPNPRDLPLSLIQQLTNIPGITFYCLQKEHEDLDGTSIIDFGSDFDVSRGSFMDSTAIIPHLDLVISVDTAIGHLAGALGTPVWVVLGCESDYRWFNGRTDTMWYPSMRLFKQKTPDNWDNVITEIKSELTKMVLLEE